MKYSCEECKKQEKVVYYNKGRWICESCQFDKKRVG